VGPTSTIQSTTTPTTTTSSTSQTTAPTTSTGLTPPPIITASTSAGAPFRPTYPEGYCPTGFYACLARAGGGCCQTGRDCSTQSCPPTPLTTITTNGATIVVPVSDVPSLPTSTCAGGWYLCGSEAGPVPGCCPDGYQCGIASCTTVAASRTAAIDKQLPRSAASIYPINTASLLAAFALSAIALVLWC
jgi:progranulin